MSDSAPSNDRQAWENGAPMGMFRPLSSRLVAGQTASSGQWLQPLGGRSLTVLQPRLFLGGSRELALQPAPSFDDSPFFDTTEWRSPQSLSPAPSTGPNSRTDAPVSPSTVSPGELTVPQTQGTPPSPPPDSGVDEFSSGVPAADIQAAPESALASPSPDAAAIGEHPPAPESDTPKSPPMSTSERRPESSPPLASSVDASFSERSPEPPPPPLQRTPDESTSGSAADLSGRPAATDDAADASTGPASSETATSLEAAAANVESVQRSPLTPDPIVTPPSPTQSPETTEPTASDTSLSAAETINQSPSTQRPGGEIASRAEPTDAADARSLGTSAAEPLNLSASPLPTTPASQSPVGPPPELGTASRAPQEPPASPDRPSQPPVSPASEVPAVQPQAADAGGRPPSEGTAPDLPHPVEADISAASEATFTPTGEMLSPPISPPLEADSESWSEPGIIQRQWEESNRPLASDSTTDSTTPPTPSTNAAGTAAADDTAQLEEPNRPSVTGSTTDSTALPASTTNASIAADTVQRMSAAEARVSLPENDRSSYATPVESQSSPPGDASPSTPATESSDPAPSSLPSGTTAASQTTGTAPLLPDADASLTPSPTQNPDQDVVAADIQRSPTPSSSTAPPDESFATNAPLPESSPTTDSPSPAVAEQPRLEGEAEAPSPAVNEPPESLLNSALDDGSVPETRDRPAAIQRRAIADAPAADSSPPAVMANPGSGDTASPLVTEGRMAETAANDGEASPAPPLGDAPSSLPPRTENLRDTEAPEIARSSEDSSSTVPSPNSASTASEPATPPSSSVTQSGMAAVDAMSDEPLVTPSPADTTESLRRQPTPSSTVPDAPARPSESAIETSPSPPGSPPPPNPTEASVTATERSPDVTPRPESSLSDRAAEARATSAESPATSHPPTASPNTVPSLSRQSVEPADDPDTPAIAEPLASSPVPQKAFPDSPPTPPTPLAVKESESSSPTALSPTDDSVQSAMAEAGATEAETGVDSTASPVVQRVSTDRPDPMAQTNSDTAVAPAAEPSPLAASSTTASAPAIDAMAIDAETSADSIPAGTAPDVEMTAAEEMSQPFLAGDHESIQRLIALPTVVENLSRQAPLRSPPPLLSPPSESTPEVISPARDDSSPAVDRPDRSPITSPLTEFQSEAAAIAADDTILQPALQTPEPPAAIEATNTAAQTSSSTETGTTVPQSWESIEDLLNQVSASASTPPPAPVIQRESVAAAAPATTYPNLQAAEIPPPVSPPRLSTAADQPIQRLQSEPPSPNLNTMSYGVSESDAPAAETSANLEKLATVMYQMVRQRFAIERERLGRSGSNRF